MEDKYKVVLSVLSWVPTADQINLIKPDQSVGNWSGSVGMSGIEDRVDREAIYDHLDLVVRRSGFDRAEVHLGSLEIRKMSCGGRKKSSIPFLFQGSMLMKDGQTAEINTISPDKLNILMPAAATAVYHVFVEKSAFQTERNKLTKRIRAKETINANESILKIVPEPTMTNRA
ncbi:hypothetical protein DPMN_023236 [Dreissena polymorpha]|uniref:Uncharacterized protein n=1 Tax=Dreissena polymorpha TaxID=45954 RepID=A0A9D4RAJ2_DREPO|nr:hypothetical protein DPMN_023236 [Dreissena polymorpha]